MNKALARLAALASILLIAACGKGDSPSGAPTDVVATAGDGRVIVSWTTEAGPTYWVFSAADPSITLQNWTTLSLAKVLTGAIPPQPIIGLLNGTTYTFLVNGRNNGGQGGPASVPVSATPRPAGGTWTLGNPLAAANLNGIGINLPSTRPPTATLFAVGTAGVLFTSTDGVTWTAVSSSTGSDLNAALFANSKYLAVGANGTIIASSDALTWTPQLSNTVSDLKGIGVLGGTYVAVGDNGTILSSGDGQFWISRSSGTGQTLYSVASANNTLIAVGAGGTIVTSTDGSTWQPVTSPTTADLRGVVGKTDPLTNITTFVAVGAQGTIITSSDGLTWVPTNSGLTSDLSTVAFSSQFVALGVGGTVVTSLDGTAWAPGISGTSADLNSVVFGLNQYYAVGAGGVNLISQ
jgi:hypothetical protein